VSEFKDYYTVLGVPKTATQKEIRSAFRKLAAKHHPDRNPGDSGAEERFKEINEAYTVLNDEEKRRFYDQYGSEGARAPSPGAGSGPRGGATYVDMNSEEFAGFSDFFQSMFGSGFGASGRSGGAADIFGGFSQQRVQPQRPRSIEAELPLDLQTAFRGGETSFTIEGRGLTVTIPPGSRTGTRLRLRGQAPGGGDLLLRLKLTPHPRFTLDGDDVRVVVDVPDYRAALGGPVLVPTLTGDVTMSIPPGTSSGRVLRLRGQGWPGRNGKRGDELAEIRITVPAKPDAEQLRHYRELEGIAEPSSHSADAKVQE
jgi:curved DNA-binding protein